MDIRDRARALHNLPAAFYAMKEAIRRQAEATHNLTNDLGNAAEIYGQLKSLAKQQKRQQPRKSYLSPYAKFDKLRKKWKH